MVVPVETEPIFRIATAETVFEGPAFLIGGLGFGGGPQLRFEDISPDGQQFLMLKQLTNDLESGRQITVVLNWLEELKERVPIP